MTDRERAWTRLSDFRPGLAGAVGRIGCVLLAFALLSFCVPAVSAQDAATEDAATQAASDAQAETAPAEFDVPRVGPASEAPPTLAQRFDGVLGAVNKVFYDTLFFDVSFGLFQDPATDDSGNPVFVQEPVMLELEAPLRAAMLDDEANVPTDENGQPVLLEFPAGASVHQVDASGSPMFTDGPQDITGPTIPFLVIWLAAGAVFFTVLHGFINLRGFRHAVEVVRGKWAAPDDKGDIPPFRALTSALSATVGLGNIASVAVAMVAGGPGALFWMIVLGFFGMASKFHESTLAQMFRVTNPDGTVSGGPMFYLDEGLRKHRPGLAFLGKPLAVIFAVFCIFAALGGGNMFQANQAFEGFFSTFVEPHVNLDESPDLQKYVSYGFGVVMAAAVAVVVLGGITRIGAATSKIVPFMGVLYVLACATIILFNLPALPALVKQVFVEAFAWESAYGGLLGVMILGFQRAAFSSEAGLGSSAIAHAAAKTDEPIREGLVASLEPFIDTIVICCMTGLTVLITGAYLNEEGGSAVTLAAFSQVEVLAGWFPYILSVCIVLFAFSTMIAWCYYGERAWGYLFGLESVFVFRLAFVGCVFVGAVASLSTVIAFADAMLLSMALPNILGGILLAPLVKKRLTHYWSKYRSGELKPGEPVAPIPGDAGADI